MKQFLLISFLSIIAVVTLSSCGSKGSPAKSDLPSHIDDGREKHASIDFVEDFVDLGSIKHGEVITYTFKFSNSGNIPLVINDVIAGCGCTRTNLSDEVLNPTEEASLEVVFDSRGWHGSQFKSVTLVSNARTPKRSVTIKVNVTQ